MINTPCSLTIKEGRYFCSEGLQAEFEGSEVAKSLEADSYLGIAIVNSYGETTGSLCIFDDKPIANLQRADAMLRIFAARVSSELERKEAIDKLNQLNQQLESRVALRTDELQSANQQLIETNTDLARATRLKDEFLANMSHELRTPLNAVLGMSEGLRSGVFGELNSRQMRSLSLVETSGRHLLELINDILDVAKIGAGKLELEISPVSLERLCKSSFSFVKQPANQKNIQLKLLIPLNMPMIAIDERRIRQALINLLSNAVKFTAKGGKIALEVEIIKAVRDGAIAQIPDQPDQIIFSVIDTGIGISSENIDKLFQPFVQIDSSLNRQFVGTGLGLTLVKQIAELHGGSVSVTSQIDQGSCFSISLPYNIPIKLAKPNNSAADSPQTQLPVLSNSRVKPNGLIHPLILIVDDNYINIEVFTSYLSSSDYRLIVAHDGQQAVNMVISEKPDLVIMDIQMPVLDGISAIIKIREYPQFQDIPIIAVTALAMIGDREKCLAVGANEYLTKPVNLSQLNSVVKKQLSL
jgi:signal transduction histidine kinase